MNKSYGRAKVILIIIQFLVMVGFGIVIPIMPFFIGELGGGAFILGLYMSAYSIMQFFFAPFWGRLSDRIGRRPVLLIGLSGYGITFLLYGLAENIPYLIIIRAVSGMISSAAFPTAMAYMADITEEKERSKNMGMLGAAAGLGMIFGPALGGWLGDFSLTLPFYVAGAMALAIVPFAFKFLPETLKEPVKQQKKSLGLSPAVVHQPLFPFFVFNFILNFTMAMFEGTFTLFASERVGYGTVEMGLIFMLIGVVGVIVQGMLIGKLVKQFGDAFIAKFGVIFCGLGFLWIIWAPNALLLVLGTIIFMVGSSLMTPTISSLVSKQSNAGHGASLGVFQSFGSLGRIFGPVVGGGIYEFSMDAPYILGAISLFVVLLIYGSRIKDKTSDESFRGHMN